MEIRERWGFEPYPYQKEVEKEIFNNNFPLLIKSPTGSGKTEAVIFPFLSQFLQNKFFIAPRLIYVLPVRALVNQGVKNKKIYFKSDKNNKDFL